VNIRVKLFGLLDRRFPGYDPGKGMEISLPEHAQVQDLLVSLKIFEAEKVLIIRNGMALKLDNGLEEGENVYVFPITFGG
jgi:sulfur carrier protein ThiS